MWTGSNRSPYLYYRFPFKCVSFTLTNPKSVIFASLSPPILRRALENEFVGMWVPLAEQNSDILTRGETWRPPPQTRPDPQCHQSVKCGPLPQILCEDLMEEVRKMLKRKGFRAGRNRWTPRNSKSLKWGGKRKAWEQRYGCPAADHWFILLSTTVCRVLWGLSGRNKLSSCPRGGVKNFTALSI